ncbi:von Willebrand factor D and EGF domain-containing protein-like [Mytilus trossulus]|uniref:von Willebrand factor D and EGF domain-containing protein-like n=1 Tax=Mytilus trossulus TaxID=6551 RepID=UPI00300666E5
MHIERVIHQSRNYTQETPKFLCRVNDATNDYAYDINFYINNVLITGAIYTNVSNTNIGTAVLLQKHWEETFKPNMMVNCSVQARYKNRGVAGPKYFSQIYFAGIKVVDGVNGIHVEENEPISVEIKSTLPIGCFYQEGINVQRSKSGCFVGLYNGVPKYQSTDDNEVVCSDESFVQSNLEFDEQECRLTIPHVGWSNSYFINVTGVSDGIVNKVDRIVFLRLYTTIDHANKEDILKIWNSIHLPDLKIYISDKDITHIDNTCYSSNDPYLKTFDKSEWNITSPNDYGEYIMYKHETLPQQVNVYFSHCILRTGLCNCGVAVRSADSIFIANFCETGILTKRKTNRYITSRICDDQNLIVTEDTDKTFKITFPSGTVVFINRHDFEHTDSPFTFFSKIEITPSKLDFDLTTGLCGKYNNNPTDDFVTRKNSLDSKHNLRQFAKSWRIDNNSTETFFDPTRLPPLNYKVQEYCTCDAYASIQGQTSKPNFKCRLYSRMEACRQIEISTTIYHASCITSSHRQKRSLEEDDEAPPMYDMIDDEQVEVDDQPAVWRNGLTEDIARQKCENAFNILPAFEICAANVPTVQSVNYIDQCISDMKIAGSDIFLYSNIRNFETMCLNDAKKFENLTDKNINSATGESTSILTVIAEFTCPRNCSGKGSCAEG